MVRVSSPAKLRSWSELTAKMVMGVAVSETEGGLICQQPFSLPESPQTLAGKAFRSAGRSRKKFPAASKFSCQKTLPARNFVRR